MVSKRIYVFVLFQLLCVKTREYFKNKKNCDLTFGERFQFVNLW